MERREWLKLMALAFGSSVTLPESAFAKMAEPVDPAKLNFFSHAQRELVGQLTETIIPKTDTPGALDAGVPGWLELIVQDCVQENDQKILKEGLTDLEKRCQDRFQKAFAALSVEQRIELLTAMEQDARKAGNSKAFILQFKDLTKFCYVNSEVGATQAFEFHLIPGRWDASLDLKPGQKAYSF